MSEIINCEFCGKPRPETVSTCPYCKPTTQQIFQSSINKTAEKIVTTVNNNRTAREQKAKQEQSSTKTCPKCHMDIPFLATICPYCRKTIATSKVAIALAVFIAVSIAIAMYNTPAENTSPRGPNRFDIMDSAKAGMNIMLKAPASAKYPGADEWHITEASDHFMVTSYVDAQNSFGALLRNYFECIVYKSNMVAVCTIK